MSKLILQIAQIIVSILLMLSILLQNRGSGLGGAFGGSNAVYRTKRGAEKFLFFSTITLIVLFIVLSLSSIFLYK
jgi:protein translocase SecG subunit